MSPYLKSYIRLYVKDSLIESVVEKIKAGDFLSVDEETKWDVSLDLMFQGIKSIDHSNGKVLVKLDVYDVELLPGFPTEKEIQAELDVNMQRNQEIRKQHIKDIGEIGARLSSKVMGFTGSEGKCRKELRKFGLIDSVEVFFERILAIKGVKEGAIAIRNNEVGKTNEIIGFGSGENGVYTCGEEKLSDEEDWVL